MQQVALQQRTEDLLNRVVRNMLRDQPTLWHGLRLSMQPCGAQGDGCPSMALEVPPEVTRQLCTHLKQFAHDLQRFTVISIPDLADRFGVQLSDEFPDIDMHCRSDTPPKAQAPQQVAAAV